MTQPQIDISVIVCTWNNAARLHITLESICDCGDAANVGWELVVVNNNCTDETDAVVQSIGKRQLVNYVREPRQGLSRARNAGIEAARGRLLIFADDDIRPVLSWLAAYWHAFQAHDNMTFFGGAVESEYEAGPPSDALLVVAPPSVRGLEFGNAPRPLGDDESFVSANWACPTAAIQEVGAFDEQLGLAAGCGGINVGEETELQTRLRRAGYQPLCLADARVYHWVPKDKCTARHIGTRRRATAELYQVRRLTDDISPENRNVPRWLRRRAQRQWLRWLFRKCTLQRTADAEYLAYCWTAGRIAGYRRFLSEHAASLSVFEQAVDEVLPPKADNQE